CARRLTGPWFFDVW
nr:immunoglobulin heavy chain junction region [Mus musculus]